MESKEQLKSILVRILAEADLWKIGEAESFTYNDDFIKIEKTNLCWAVTINEKVYDVFPLSALIRRHLFNRYKIEY